MRFVKHALHEHVNFQFFFSSCSQLLLQSLRYYEPPIIVGYAKLVARYDGKGEAVNLSLRHRTRALMRMKYVVFLRRRCNAPAGAAAAQRLLSGGGVYELGYADLLIEEMQEYFKHH
eukprot:IDg19864t1